MDESEIINRDRDNRNWFYTTNFTEKRINVQKAKMNVHLKAQALNESVTFALELMQIMDTEFENTSETAKLY